MPEKVIREDGSEREVPTQEELDELQKRAEERKKQRDEVKSELEQNKEKLTKLENKDFNFKKLRDMTKEEQEKLSETERQLKEHQEKLEEQQQNFTQQLKEEWKNEALAVLVGQDNETKKEVEENLKVLNLEPKNKQETQDMVRKAYNMTGKTAPSYNPFSYAHGSKGASKNASSKGTEEVDPELAKNLQINEDDLKKYKK